jgi:hypothetical protein
VLGTKRDAELFEADMKRRKRLGQLAEIDAGRQTVAEFAREWWRVHAEPNLTPRTRETYAIVFDKHILPRVGGLPLRDVTPAVVAGPERRPQDRWWRARRDTQGTDGAARPSIASFSRRGVLLAVLAIIGALIAVAMLQIPNCVAISDSR